MTTSPDETETIPTGFYEVLGLDTAVFSEMSPAKADAMVKGAHRTLAAYYHPDKDTADAAWYAAVDEAFAALNTPQGREEYDLMRLVGDGEGSLSGARFVKKDEGVKKFFGEKLRREPKVKSHSLIAIMLDKLDPATWELKYEDKVILSYALVIEAAFVAVVCYCRLAAKLWHAGLEVARLLMLIPFMIWLLLFVVFVVLLIVPQTREGTAAVVAGPALLGFVHVKGAYRLVRWLMRITHNFREWLGIHKSPRP